VRHAVGELEVALRRDGPDRAGRHAQFALQARVVVERPAVGGRLGVEQDGAQDDEVAEPGVDDVAMDALQPWALLEHLRIAQWDILEFSRNPKHVSPPRPDGYWLRGDAEPSARAWNRSVKAFRADLAAMCALVADPFAPIPHGDGQTVLREALLVADHNAYHLGQLVVVRRLLGCWPEEG
jgi:hypothetical protein